MGELREGSRQLLLALGQLPAVREGNTEHAANCCVCWKPSTPTIQCSATARRTDGSIAECGGDGRLLNEDEFFRAIGRDGLAVGNYRVDPVTGLNTFIALRFADKDGVAASFSPAST